MGFAALNPSYGPRLLSSVIRLALFYAALFAALGVQLPFLPVWLAAKGLDAATIGLVLAVPLVVRVIVIPLATHAADRYQALRAVIATAAAAAVLGYGASVVARSRLPRRCRRSRPDPGEPRDLLWLRHARLAGGRAWRR